MIPIAKPYLTADEAQYAYDTILSGWVTQGPKVAEFEEKFALSMSEDRTGTECARTKLSSSKLDPSSCSETGPEIWDK